MHFNPLHIITTIYYVIFFTPFAHISICRQTKTLLSKDNKVLLASQERFELPTVRLEGVCSIRLSYWDMERVKRIELSTRAWKALVLPLNYTRICYFIFFVSAVALSTIFIICITIHKVNTFLKEDNFSYPLLKTACSTSCPSNVSKRTSI